MLFHKLLICGIFLLTNLLAIQAGVNPEIEAFNGTAADIYDWSKHPCRRNCEDDTVPMTCEYVFVVESYTTMSKACYDCPRNITDCSRQHCLAADGYVKPVYVVNRKLPGPAIEVCEGDRIVVDVRNALAGSTTTIHWHGIRLVDNPYMDGTPYVTQCPILPGQKFRYNFVPSQSGSYLWHSHIAGQRSNGLFGKLIVRSPPKNNPLSHLYDFDHHSMIIIDWKEQSQEDFYATGVHNGPNSIRTILVNGMGRHHNFAKDNEDPLYTPVDVFNVQKGFRYRFRLINAGSDDCPIQVSVDNHTMYVISTDANDFEPVEVDALFAWPGERYDFIINANQTIDNYWIRYRGYEGLCVKGDSELRVFQVATLRYDNAPLINPKSAVGWNYPNENFTKILNPLRVQNESKYININEVKALKQNDMVFTRKPDHQFHLSVNSHFIDNYENHRSGLYGINQVPQNKKGATPQLDHITFKYPAVPLLPQRDLVDSSMFCNSTTMADKNCTTEHCMCSYVLQAKLNSVVEVIVVNEASQSRYSHHPFHLHGYFFRVVGFEELDGPVSIDRIKKLDNEGKIKRNLKTAPLKDTVNVPQNGYLIIRFYTDNPGYWIYHCHIEQHAEQGLALVFKIGEHEDMLPVPENFPKCESFA